MPPSPPTHPPPPSPSRRAWRGALTVALTLPIAALTVAGGNSAPAAVAGPSPAGVAYRAPVPTAVRLLRPFAAPAQPWAAGHRGVDLALDEGGTVLSPAAGTVVVAARVVDRGVVTVAHPDGRRSSLEPVAPAVVAGQQVAAGDPLGALSGERSHCAPACLHWGVREGTRYVDPLTLLPGGGPVVLLPEGG